MARKIKNWVVLKSIERSTDFFRQYARELRATRTVHVHLIDEHAGPLDRIEEMFGQQDHARLRRQFPHGTMGIHRRLIGTDERSARQMKKDQARFRPSVALVHLAPPLMRIPAT